MISPLNDWNDEPIKMCNDSLSSIMMQTLTVQQQHRRRSAPVRETKNRLPADYSPSMYSVMIGRGKIFTEAIGTRRLKVIASRFLADYSDAKSQIDKASIITRIVDIIQEACPVGAFLKYEEGSWWEVSDTMAREKVGGVLRDLLHDQYKSSTKAKSASRSKNRRKVQELGAPKSDMFSRSTGMEGSEFF